MSVSLEESLASPRPARPTPDTPSSVFSQFRLDGRVAVITGAADGIGFAVAEAYAEAGAHLALWYNRNDAAIAKGAELARTYGVNVKAYQVRVQDPEAVREAVAAVLRDFGGALDVFVANAGMGNSKPLLDMSIEEYRELMGVNCDGVVFCAKYAGEVFRQRGKGVLIITSSISAHIVNVPVDQPVYNAGKAAITHLGKSLAREWREFARVNIVSPGFFETKMGASPNVVNEANRMAVLGRQGDVREIKGLYLYLASDASSYTTGTDVVIDGGYVLP